MSLFTLSKGSEKHRTEEGQASAVGSCAKEDRSGAEGAMGTAQGGEKDGLALDKAAIRKPAQEDGMAGKRESPSKKMTCGRRSSRADGPDKLGPPNKLPVPAVEPTGVGNGQKHKRLEAVQEELTQLADLGRRVPSVS